MRTVVFLLLLANLSLFAYIKLDTMGAGEAVRLSEQVQPDRIRILTPQQVAALGPEKVASMADVCLEWGPFSDAERTRALAELDSLQLGRLLSERRAGADTAWWVSLGPFATRAAGEKRAAELRQQGLTDVSVVDNGRGAFAVSLGVYRNEQNARGRADSLVQQNVRGTHVEPRGQPAAQTLLVVRDPPQNVAARIKELQTQYAGTDVHVGSCATS